jgi:hypothetical protein
MGGESSDVINNKVLRHKESCAESIRFDFLSIRANARNVITAINPHRMIYNKPALMHLQVAYLMGYGEPLASSARPGVDPNDGLVLAAERKTRLGSLEMMTHNYSTFSFGDFLNWNRRFANPVLLN